MRRVKFIVHDKYLVARRHLKISKPFLILIQPAHNFGVTPLNIYTMDPRG